MYVCMMYLVGVPDVERRVLGQKVLPIAVRRVCCAVVGSLWGVGMRIYIYIDVGVYMEWVAVPTGSFNPPTHPPTDHAPTHPSIYPQIHPHTNVRGVGRLGVPLDGLARLVQEGHLAGALFFGRRGGDIG